MNPANNFAAHPRFSNLMTFAANLMIAIGAACLIMLTPSRSLAQQATLTDDAQISTVASNQNFGANSSVRVSGTNIRGFFKFKLTPNLPSGTTGSRVGKATVRFFVGTVNTPGTFDVFRVNGSWDEATITGGTAPPLGILESSISVDALQTNKWLTLDVTQLVKDWLDGVLPNEGIALVANGGVGNVLFNSKENQTTSHETQLEIVLNHAATADRATEAHNATTATNAMTANALAASATVNANQVSGDLTNATISGSRVGGTVANASNAATSNVTRGVVSAAQDADIISPVAGQLYFNTTTLVFRQYDGTTWKTIDAGLTDMLRSSGTLNAPTNPVDWTQLKNVPANSANGYVAGSGIQIDAANVISNIGVLSVSANGPLSSNGGPNPTVSLGVVPVANGGTGLISPGTAGNFLRSDGLSWVAVPLQISDIPSGSNSYIQNTTTLQSGDFNIDGNGTMSGTMSANIVNAATAYSIGGLQVLRITGTSNTLVGKGAGERTSGDHNSFFGREAGLLTTTGTGNNFFGSRAGQGNTTGNANSFFGGGLANKTGSRNAFFGAGAGQLNTDGHNNTFLGSEAGLNNTTGSGNTSVGFSAGLTSDQGIDNTYIGTRADGAPALTNATAIGAGAFVQQSNTMVLGTNNVTVQVPGNFSVSGSISGNFTGTVSASSISGILSVSNGGTGVNSTGVAGNFFRSDGTNWVSAAFTANDVPAGSASYVQNTTMQQAASNFNISGDGTAGGTLSAGSVNAVTQYNINGSRALSTPGFLNVFAGMRAGQNNSSGSSNSFFGGHAGFSNTTGTSNSFFGSEAGRNNTASGNSFFGNNAGLSNTDGGGNAFFGAFAGRDNISGSNNSFFGATAGQSNTEGKGNSFFGTSAGRLNTTGRNNTYMGDTAGQNNVTGEHNSFFGAVAGLRNTANNNSFFGSRAGVNNTSGNGNVFVGFSAGLNNTIGLGNAFLGSNAGLSNTTGIENTFIGLAVGLSNTVENNNTFIGARANGVPGIHNATAIGSNAVVTQSNSIVLGDDVNVGIGTTAPQAKLHVQGGNILIGSAGQGIILKSPSGTACRLLTIDDNGAMVLTTVACP